MRWCGSVGRAGEIAFVRKRGRQAACAAFAAFAVDARHRGSGAAIAVPKAVGKAVVRNLIKRRIRGALDALPPPARPARLVFLVRPAAAAVPYAALAADVAAAMRRIAPPAAPVAPPPVPRA